MKGFEMSPESAEHFRVHGWMRVPSAFTADEAAAMRDAVWRVLATRGIRKGEPSSWSEERPVHLQALKDDPVFRTPWSKQVIVAIDEVLEGQAWQKPKSCGALFIAFPRKSAWNIPASGWHIDANYTSELSPPAGVKVHALFGDVAQRGGGTQIVSGSHRVVHKWFKGHPPPTGTRGAEFRELLKAHPYIRDLHIEGDPDARITRFKERVEEVDGIPLQVTENTGFVGDVILLHPLVLHVAVPNNGKEPRFFLSGGVDTDAMWGAYSGLRSSLTPE
jgi:Phytanoyl-CoA dioxygenase (PhyH)